MIRFEFVLSNTKKEKQMLNSNDRLHWTKTSSIVRYLKHLASQEMKDVKGARPLYHKQNTCRVRVIVFSPTRRRLDPPNFYPTVKALVDGFTESGLWDDDNHEIIKSMSFEYGGLSEIKGKYRLVLEVNEID